MKNLKSEINGRTPVLVSTPYSVGKTHDGIQFWTIEMIEKGTSKNTDGTISTFIKKIN